MKTVLPYLNKTKDYSAFLADDLNDALREGLAMSARHPCYLEVSDMNQQRLVFLRNKQIYSAGEIEDGQFRETTIKEFLQSCVRLRSPSAAWYEVNSKILHSLLILFQKKPSLKVDTSLVDLDEVLDKIEEDGKSCVISATYGSFLSVLRYEKGEVTALCQGQSSLIPKDRSFRDDFLIGIYTLSAESPLTITIHEELLVRYARDAKMLDETDTGDLTHLYLAKPPTVSLEFKDKEVGHWILDKSAFNIGRTDENHIQIDNLAVSRLHAVLERDKGHYYIRDCDSLNGTLLNGQKVGRARLGHGDEIVIGKHKLVFRDQRGMELPATPDTAPIDQTVIIGTTRDGLGSQQEERGGAPGPRLIERTSAGESVFELNKLRFVLGNDGNADLEIDGMFVAPKHAEIIQVDGKYILRHVNGQRRVTVSGKRIKERVLRDQDAIRIGKREFVFEQ